MNYYVHPSSVIDEGCRIGAGTRIWHFCHVMPGAVIGKDCILGQNVMIASNVVVGNNVKIQNNVSLYEGVICEDNVFLGPGVVLTNVINPRSAVSRKAEFKKTLIQQGASIGANATIVCGHTIGAYAFIGAGAVVTKDVPAYALIMGNPGRQTGWMSEHGCRLVFGNDKKAVCAESGQVYVLESNSVRRIN
ncbi:MAG: N-acetyltransferase [Ferruginibacter sp.]|nr:N-acetyltransferase [Ferruginibacter sp.]